MTTIRIIKKGRLTCVGVGFRLGDVDAACRRRKRIRL